MRCRALSAFVFILILTGLTGCKKPPNSVSGGAAYLVPVQPPKSHYLIDARVDAARALIEGQEKITLKNNSSLPLNVVALDWQMNGSSSMDVTAQGQKLSPKAGPSASNPGSPVFFNLPRAVVPGEELKLDISFRQKFGDPKEESGGTTSWYPRLWWDGLPVHEAFSVKLEVPEGYALAASGRLDPKTGRYEAESARTFGIYLGKGMKTESREVDGVLITSLFTEKGAKAASICLETAADAIKYYKEWLGFYPFPFLTIIPGGPGAGAVILSPPASSPSTALKPTKKENRRGIGSTSPRMKSAMNTGESGLWTPTIPLGSGFAWGSSRIRAI